MYSLIPIVKDKTFYSKKFWNTLQFNDIDKREISQITGSYNIGKDIVKAIERSTDVHLVFIDNAVEGVFGIAYNSCWLICTDKVRLNKLSLIKEAKRFIKKWKRETKCIDFMGLILKENARSIKFLKYLGATFINFHGTDFYKFII